MRIKKITNLKDWLIVGTLGWGLPFATVFAIVSWKELTVPVSILYLSSMGGGFCLGGLMFVFTWVYLKIKEWILLKINKNEQVINS